MTTVHAEVERNTKSVVVNNSGGLDVKRTRI